MVKKMKTLVFKNITSKEASHTLPQIEIRTTDSDKVIGYLTPYKGYKFQVSKTATGVGNIGSSGVVGLANIVSAFANFERKDSSISIWKYNILPLKGCLMALALEAINNFGIYENEHFGNLDFENYEVLNDFIGDTISYIKNLIK